MSHIVTFERIAHSTLGRQRCTCGAVGPITTMDDVFEAIISGHTFPHNHLTV